MGFLAPLNGYFLRDGKQKERQKAINSSAKNPVVQTHELDPDTQEPADYLSGRRGDQYTGEGDTLNLESQSHTNRFGIKEISNSFKSSCIA